VHLENSPEIFKQDCDSIAREFPHLFKNIHQKKILITGISGFFGSWVLGVLNSAIDFYSLETEVYCLVRRNLDKNKKNFWLKEIHGDIQTFNFGLDFVSPLVGETDQMAAGYLGREGACFFDYVLHMAGNKSWEDIVGGTENLIKNLNQSIAPLPHVGEGMGERAAQGERRIPRVLFTSSGGVYGKKSRTDQPIPESLQPDLLGADWYSKAKITAENLLLDFKNNNKKFDLIIARCFAFYGYGQPLNQGFAVADMADSAQKNKIIKIKNINTVRSFMHMGDLVRALFFLLLNPDQNISGPNSSIVYNIGGERSEAILKTAEKISKIYPSEILWANTPDNFQPLNYYVPDVQKLKALGFVERF